MDSLELEEFLENQKKMIQLEKNAFIEQENEYQLTNRNEVCNQANQLREDIQETNINELNVAQDKQTRNSSELINSEQNTDLILEQIDLLRLDINDHVERKKQIFIDKLINSENALMNKLDERKCAMLRIGEYSPNNSQLRVKVQPFLGIGEYEHQKKLANAKQKANLENNKIHYDLDNNNAVEKELSPLKDELNNLNNNRELSNCGADKKANNVKNVDFVNANKMDKPKGILTNRRTEGSSKDYYSSSYKSTSLAPTFMDCFSYSDPVEDLKRERRKREMYNRELQIQIEEKRRMQAMRDEQDRKEQELENRRLQQQLLRMQEEAMADSPRNESMRRNSEDASRYRQNERHSRPNYRTQANSENSFLGASRNHHASLASNYSPPASRRNHLYSSSLNNAAGSSFSTSMDMNKHSPNRYDLPYLYRRDTLNRMDSLNINDNSYNNYGSSPRSKPFARFDSLSKIDTLNHYENGRGRGEWEGDVDINSTQRRHSATQQDLSSFRRSPKLYRRSNSSRFAEDNLPIPVLKAHSPVARELKHSVPFNSARSMSEACRKMEDRWQIPAVQKTIINHTDSLRDGQNRSILTQIGAIRMKLQQEQMKMEEKLHKRVISQSKAVDFHN